MARIRSDGYEDVVLEFVDGYLPSRAILEALFSDRDIVRVDLPPIKSLSDDELAEAVGSTVMGEYHGRGNPGESLGYGGQNFCDAWILSSHEVWPDEFALSEESYDAQRRRSIIRIARGCDAAVSEACLTNLLDAEGIVSIPRSQYRDYEAFRTRALELLNTVAEPYIAPPLIVLERLRGMHCKPVAYDL